MHGQYVRGKEGTDLDRIWQWIAKAQEQALRTNYTNFHIDHTAESLCAASVRE